MTTESAPEEVKPPCERCGGDGYDPDQSTVQDGALFYYSDDPSTPNPCRVCYWYHYYGDQFE